jgi:hypothetical protein
MKSSASFSVTEYGATWPSGDFVEAAMIDISCEEVSTLISGDLIEGIEPGMGPWKAIGLQLDAGEVIELIRYVHDPDHSFVLRIDAGENLAATFEKVLSLLGRSKESLIWVSPLVSTKTGTPTI